MLQAVRLQHIRVHKDITVDFSPHVSVIYGTNGSGKTSILEAIALAYQGKSFRGASRDIVSMEFPWYRVDLIDNAFERSVKYRAEDNVRQFEVDSKQSKVLPRKYRFPIVLFEPDDLRLIQGSPARRRQYIDHLIEQIMPRYTTLIRRYERTLIQRNKLLKSPFVSKDSLFAWDVSLAKYGADIINERTIAIKKINNDIERIYRSVAGTVDDVRIYYPTAYILSQQQILHNLQQNTERDMIIGTTSVGPHRHDFSIDFNKKIAGEVMSRGEIRTFILALKFIELNYIQEETGLTPLFLLDDVFGELDDNRKRNLSHTFSTHQVIITTTEKIDNLPKDTHYIQL